MNLRFDLDDNVIIAVGNTQGLSKLFHAVINPGDEAILTDPGFPSHIIQAFLPQCPMQGLGHRFG